MNRMKKVWLRAQSIIVLFMRSFFCFDCQDYLIEVTYCFNLITIIIMSIRIPIIKSASKQMILSDNRRLLLIFRCHHEHWTYICVTMLTPTFLFAWFPHRYGGWMAKSKEKSEKSAFERKWSGRISRSLVYGRILAYKIFSADGDDDGVDGHLWIWLPHIIMIMMMSVSMKRKTWTPIW